jgi:hypothetical protein
LSGAIVGGIIGGADAALKDGNITNIWNGRSINTFRRFVLKGESVSTTPRKIRIISPTQDYEINKGFEGPMNARITNPYVNRNLTFTADGTTTTIGPNSTRNISFSSNTRRISLTNPAGGVLAARIQNGNIWTNGPRVLGNTPTIQVRGQWRGYNNFLWYK